jgi:hypothetical protein
MNEQFYKTITVAEAVELERANVLRKFETRMLIAIEVARRDAVRKGHDQLRAIGGDQQVNGLFCQVVNESAHAGLMWQMLEQFGKKEFPKAEDFVRENIQQATKQAGNWLVRLVTQLIR